jgi:hypothetical protein
VEAAAAGPVVSPNVLAELGDSPDGALTLRPHELWLRTYGRGLQML